MKLTCLPNKVYVYPISASSNTLNIELEAFLKRFLKIRPGFSKSLLHLEFARKRAFYVRVWKVFVRLQAQRKQIDQLQLQAGVAYTH
jgi:hypothetical protein